MRYTFLTLLTCVLIAPMGRKNKHDSSDEQSTQTSNTDQQSGVTLPSSQKDEIIGSWQDMRANPFDEKASWRVLLYESLPV
jgi:hypothetical protein